MSASPSSMPSPAPLLSSLAEDVRRFDPDRFFTALFAPSDRREDLFALYAFNSEVARIRETVTEPVLGQMRIQWWRDTLNTLYHDPSQAVQHPTAAALGAAITRYSLPQQAFEDLLDARERDMDPCPIPDQESLSAYLHGTGGELARLAMAILGGGNGDSPESQAAGKLGSAYALCGLIRAMFFHARQGRSYMPSELLSDHGADTSGWEHRQADAGTKAAIAELRQAAQEALQHAREDWKKVPRSGRRALVAAALPATLTEGHLARLASVGDDPFHPDLAAPKRRPVVLLWRSWRGVF